MFIERIIFQLVEEGIAWYAANPARYERFLIAGGLTETEAVAARQAFVDQPPTAIHGYARQGGPFPCLALVLGGENTAQDWVGEDVSPLGSDGEPCLDPETNEVGDYKGRRWEHRFDWFVYADHPDLTLYYYYLLRRIMVGLRSQLQAEGLDEITYQGAELAPDPRYMPSDMFTRRFSITLRADELYIERHQPGVGLGRSIRGLRTEDEGSPLSDALTAEQQAELAGVTYGVTTYTEDEDA